MRCYLTAVLATAAWLGASAAAQLPAPPGGAVKRTERAEREASAPVENDEDAARPRARPRARPPAAPMREAWLRFKNDRSGGDHPATEPRRGDGEPPDRIREHIRDRAEVHSHGRGAKAEAEAAAEKAEKTEPKPEKPAAPAARRAERRRSSR